MYGYMLIHFNQQEIWVDVNIRDVNELENDLYDESDCDSEYDE